MREVFIIIGGHMKDVRKITMGAITAGFTAIILFADYLSAGFFMVFATIPLMLYGYHYGFKASLPVYVTCVMVSYILTGYFPTFMVMIGYGLCGLIGIYGREKKMSQGLTFLLMLMMIIPFYAFMVYFFGGYFGISIKETTELVNQYIPLIGSVTTVHIIVLVSILLTASMEIFVIQRLSILVYTILMQRIKPTKNSNRL